MGRDSADTDSALHDGRAGLLGVAAALSFGVGLYATGRVSSGLPVAWAVLPPRIVGVLLIALPLAVTARLVLTREAAPLVLVAGVAEVVGFASFALGARHGIAVSAVLASQFAAVAAVAAYFVFGERLTRVQIVGVVTIASGVAILSALQA
jgi:drug/metabolite transporter (DMT)-like permease